jgi:imidazolonepropionase-like amidohydrolase
MTDTKTVIHAEHLLDVVTGEWTADARLLVADGRVEAVLRAEDPGPTDAADLDVGGWVVPGLIDCHSHQVGDIEFAGVPATTTTASEEALIGVRNARVTLAAGFTTVRDVGSYRAFVDVELERAIEAGWTPGPRMQSCGAMVTCPGGGGDVTGLARDIELPASLRFGVVRTPQEMREKVRALIGGGAGVIKLIVTGAVLTRGTKPGFVELDAPMVEAAVEEAARQGVFVAAHAHGTEGIKVAIRAGVRSIEHGSLIDDEGIALLIEHGTYLVADVYDGDWINEEGARAGWPAETMAKNVMTTEAQREGFSKAVKAGARIAFGTDSGVYPHGRNAIQFGYQVRLGQTPLEAVRSATMVAAECMGWDTLVGSLRPGRFADLVALPSDPLQDIDALRSPLLVVKGGEPVG